MKKILILCVLLITPLLFSQYASSSSMYSVYCANGKIEVDNRTLQQMQSIRSNVYRINSFTHMTDANNFASRMGGIGASCPNSQAPSSSSSSMYSVYCANGRIEVDNRTLQQMQSIRSNVYQINSFNFMSDANNFASRMGGVGAACPQ